MMFVKGISGHEGFGEGQVGDEPFKSNPPLPKIFKMESVSGNFCLMTTKRLAEKQGFDGAHAYPGFP